MDMDKDFAISAGLEQAGLPPVGGISRPQEFHEGVAAIAEKAIFEIEAMMGGKMPQEARDIFHKVAERSANLTGPQLTITFECEASDDGPQMGM